MEININLDVQSIIANAVSAERVQPIVDKAISEAIKDAISDATGYSSQFRKELKAQLSDALPHGLGIDDCAKFQQMINRAVTEAVHGANAEVIQTAMKAGVKAVLPDVPARIKLSEFMKEARHGFHKEDHEAFYAHLEISEYGSGHLYLDRDEDCREKYRADMRIAFTKEGEVYSLKLDGIDITPKSTPSAVGSFDGLLLAMYVGRTSLDVDIDEDEVEYAARSKDDY
jgi:hypothetical protein